MSPDALWSLLSLLLGFALAGALTTGYQLVLSRRAGFRMLMQTRMARSLAAVPFLVFAAPFLIMRNTLRDTPQQPRRAEFVMMATVLAGFWSLMSGTATVMALRAAGVLT